MPVIVTEWAPTLAPAPTITVIVDVPEPGAAIEVGLKVTLCPAPCPDADKVIAESKPLSAAVVIVAVPDLPLTTVIALGDAPMLNEGLAVEVTVKVIVAVCVMPPPAPVTVIG